MSETETEAKPAAVQVFARTASGVEVNITEGVQALYHLVIGSMDWGSGFLTTEDALPVARVARVCGFERADEARALRPDAGAQPAAGRVHPNAPPDLARRPVEHPARPRLLDGRPVHVARLRRHAIPRPDRRIDPGLAWDILDLGTRRQARP